MKLLRTLLVGALVGCSSPAPPPPPVPTPPSSAPSASTRPAADDLPLARREDVVDTLHGVKVADPYRWLEDGDAPEVKAFLEAHQKRTRAHLDALPGREALEKRLEELSYLEWVRPPLRRGKRLFFERRHKDKEKSVWYWREGEGGEPKVLIDPNLLSDDGSVSLKGVYPSWNGRWVAYKLSENNADESTMFLMDVATGKKSEIDTIVGAKYASASWNPEGTAFYYTRLPVDEAIPVAERPGYAQIFLHRVGQSPEKDELVYDKTGDPKTFIGPDLSHDGRFLFLYKFHGWTSNDLYVRDLKKRGSKLQPIGEGEDAKFSAVAHQGKLYVHTNLDAPRWRLFEVDPNALDRASWKEIVPQHESAVLEEVSVIGGDLVLSYLDAASSRVVVADMAGKKIRDLELPGIGSVIGPVGNPDHDTAFYGFSSFTTPSTVFETSMKKGGKKPYFTLDVPVDPSPYLVEQLWFPSKDGTKVSMFVVRRKDMPRDGSTPMVLHGYGGFNINKTPQFIPSWFVFLEHGGALALVNLRGGGEYGEQWHKDGMREKKQNVFDDYVAAAEHLIAQKYTSNTRLAIEGGSNGGLLVGAVMTQRPDLYRAVICAVPLLDMVRYHLFGSGKTWISEYGSADEPEMFPYLLAYSPYHHVKEGTAYPALLMLTADSDDRVDPLHARKFVAAVRHANTSDHPVLLRVETHAGHGGGDMVKKTVAREADIYSFLFEQLGMSAKVPAP